MAERDVREAWPDPDEMIEVQARTYENNAVRALHRWFVAIADDEPASDDGGREEGG